MTEKRSILKNEAVLKEAQTFRNRSEPCSLSDIIEFSRSLALAREDDAAVTMLAAELEGYEKHKIEIPERRRVVGFASSFPVRAIGHLDPEEIFLANRDKFAQVSLTMGQPIHELVAAVDRLDESGVIELRVPASEIIGEAATVNADTEIHIYILPNEIRRVVSETVRLVLDDVLKSILVACPEPGL